MGAHSEPTDHHFLGRRALAITGLTVLGAVGGAGAAFAGDAPDDTSPSTSADHGHDWGHHHSCGCDDSWKDDHDGWKDDHDGWKDDHDGWKDDHDGWKDDHDGWNGDHDGWKDHRWSDDRDCPPPPCPGDDHWSDRKHDDQHEDVTQKSILAGVL